MDLVQEARSAQGIRSPVPVLAQAVLPESTRISLAYIAVFASNSQLVKREHIFPGTLRQIAARVPIATTANIRLQKDTTVTSANHARLTQARTRTHSTMICQTARAIWS